MESTNNNGNAANEPLSDKWYTLKEVCKMLDIAITTSKNYRKSPINPLIVSKRFGKLYVNEYHYQKFLRDGLPCAVSLLVLLSGWSDAFDLLFAS